LFIINPFFLKSGDLLLRKIEDFQLTIIVDCMLLLAKNLDIGDISTENCYNKPWLQDIE
jgi:hypothetical protein